MSHKADVTAIVLTLNEEQNIENCLRSLEPLSTKIFVIDSGSTDKTKKIALDYGAQFVEHEFESYSAQFNWALDNLPLQTRWVIRIDADEVITPELAEEIRMELSINQGDEVTGYIIRQKIFFLGKFMKHGGAYPFRKLMIFRRGIGRIEDKYMDEHTVLSSGRTKELRSDGEHFDFKSLDSYIRKMNWYASREVNDYLVGLHDKPETMIHDKKIEKKRSKKGLYYQFPMFVRAWLFYVYRYYFLLGFLDGKEGRVFHYLQAYWYRFLVDAKIHEKLVYNKDASLTKTGKLS